MTIPHASDNLELHLQSIKQAIDCVNSFTPPANYLEIFKYHLLFLVSFCSIIDYAKSADDAFEQRFIKALSFPKHKDGRNNYRYLHELRNALIHRGMDIVQSAEIINGAVLVIAPEKMENNPEYKKRESHKSFANHLSEMFVLGRDSLIEALEPIIKKEIAASKNQTFAELKSEFLSGAQNASHMPMWVKEMIFSNVDNLPFDKIKAGKIKRLESMLESE